MDVSFADYISYRNGCEYVKEAVSGTTLVDNGKTSYIQRMKNNIGTDEKLMHLSASFPRMTRRRKCRWENSAVQKIWKILIHRR